MDKNAPEILRLRMDIEHRLGRRVCTPADFDTLADVVWKQTKEPISPTTLKRMWGYIDGSDTIRRSTLCILAQFLGYADWEAWLNALNARGGSESAVFAGEGIRSEDLQPGDRVELRWLPNRRCVVRYEGNLQYVVEDQQNSKLQVGDRFTAACFLLSQPAYCDRLLRDGNPPATYTAGSKHGLSYVQLLNTSL